MNSLHGLQKVNKQVGRKVRRFTIELGIKSYETREVAPTSGPNSVWICKYVDNFSSFKLFYP